MIDRGPAGPPLIPPPATSTMPEFAGGSTCSFSVSAVPAVIAVLIVRYASPPCRPVGGVGVPSEKSLAGSASAPDGHSATAQIHAASTPVRAPNVGSGEERNAECPCETGTKRCAYSLSETGLTVCMVTPVCAVAHTVAGVLPAPIAPCSAARVRRSSNGVRMQFEVTLCIAVRADFDAAAALGDAVKKAGYEFVEQHWTVSGAPLPDQGGNFDL